MLRLVRFRKRRKFCDCYICMELRGLVTKSADIKKFYVLGGAMTSNTSSELQKIWLYFRVCVSCVAFYCDGAKACNHINQIIKLSLTNGCSVPFEITNYFCPEVTNVRHDKTPKKHMGQLNPTQQALTIFIMPTKVPMKTQFQNCELWCSVYKSKSPFSELVTVINWFNLFSTLAQENEAARWRSGQRGGKSFFSGGLFPHLNFPIIAKNPSIGAKYFFCSNAKCKQKATYYITRQCSNEHITSLF